MIVKIPEPFASALRVGRPSEVCDAAADTPEALFGRALARGQVGRSREARADLEVAEPRLGDVCRLEIILIELREGKALEDLKKECVRIIAKVAPDSTLFAKACHVLGLVEGKLRNVGEAAEWLTRSMEVYRRHGDRAELAQVQDTLGSLHASMGRLDLALAAHAASLVEKTSEGDRFGMAITLGNVGRIHLRLGRYHDALHCFDLNRRIAGELGDVRGLARMSCDFGRAYMGAGDMEKAEAALRESLAAATREGYADLEFYARKDLTRLHIRRGDIESAERELALAEQAASRVSQPYLDLLLRAVRGELLLARGDEGAVDSLEDVARRYAELNLPDEEIPLRIALARAYARSKLKHMAGACLAIACERARREGYERYLRQVREAMAEIGTVEGVRLEHDRLPAPGAAAAPDPAMGYTALSYVCKGAFGSVWRAYDSQRDEIVAIKRIELGRVYDAGRRRDLLASARLELEAAARLRHPGIARVFALGEDTQGGIYLVEEYIRGKTLRQIMDAGKPELKMAVSKTRLICEALDALHRENIVHRDIKPANIILRDPEGTPVIVDLGIAHLGGSGEGLDASAIVGTPAYMAPEQYEGGAADPKMDMYSVGVILCEWLTGSRPIDLSGRDPAPRPIAPAALQSKLEESPPGFEALARLCAELLDPEPQRRPSARAAVDVLAKLEGESAPDFGHSTTSWAMPCLAEGLRGVLMQDETNLL